jgi:CBS domain-containing protein
MSPRAAWRLESLGFTRVIDYVPGKQGWYEEGRPREGKAEAETWLTDLAGSDIPLCRPGDRLNDLRRRLPRDGFLGCVVVNEHNIVFGVLRKKAFEEADPERTAADVMDPAPKTFRPNGRLTDLISSMRENDVKSFSLVTTHSGEFLAAISRADAEATLEHDEEEHAHKTHERLVPGQ